MTTTLADPTTALAEQVLAGTPIPRVAKANGVQPADVIAACRAYAKKRVVQEGELALVDPQSTFLGGARTYNPSALVTRRGLSVYDAMRADDQVKAALEFKKLAVLATGWEVTSPAGKPADWAPRRLVEYVLRNVAGSFHSVLKEVLTALDYGYSVTEKVFNTVEATGLEGYIGLRALKTRRPHELDFRLDDYGNLLPLGGVTQRGPKGPLPLPVEKFLVFTHQGEFGNPYGRSDLEAAYRPWWVKENAYKWLAMLLERFGIPPIFALYDPNSLTAQQVNQLLNAIKRIQAATAGAIPRASKDALELWHPELAGQTEGVFVPAIDLFNRDIARALLMPNMLGVTATEGRDGSYARSRVQFDIFMLAVSFIRQQLEELVGDGIIAPLVELNFAGEKDRPLFKFLPFGDANQIDLMGKWGQLVSLGVVQPTPDDEQHIRRTFDFPHRPTDAPGAGEGPGTGAGTLDATAPVHVPAPDAGAVETPADDHDHQPRPAVENERYVDFAAVTERLGTIEKAGVKAMLPAMNDALERAIKYLRGAWAKPESAIKGLSPLKGLSPVRSEFLRMLQHAYDFGDEELGRELDRALADKHQERQYAPSVKPREAIDAMNSKAKLFVTRMDDEARERMRDAMQQSLDAGDDLPRTVERVRAALEPLLGAAAGTAAGLEAVVRTNVTDAFNMGRLEAGRRAGRYLLGWQYSAILDTRTTDYCQFMDQTVIDNDDARLEQVRPPAHYNCRSVLVPLTVGETVDDAKRLSDTKFSKAMAMRDRRFGGEMEP